MPIEDLSCAGCGAPLSTTTAQRGAIVCPYCQREHTFVTPPPEPRRHDHPVGSRVAVRWGSRWWAAEVLAVEAPERWRIRYVGWSSRWDEVVGPDRIRPESPASSASSGSLASPTPAPKRRIGCVLVGALLVAGLVVGLIASRQAGPPAVQPDGRTVEATTPLGVGQPVQVEWNDGWYEGRIRAVYPDGRVRVHYEGWADSYDEDVDRDRVLLLPGGERSVQPAGTPATPAHELRAGQRVHVEWMGSWYDATVLSTATDGTVLVHYDGWADSYDEAVRRGRIRIP